MKKGLPESSRVPKSYKKVPLKHKGKAFFILSDVQFWYASDRPKKNFSKIRLASIRFTPNLKSSSQIMISRLHSTKSI